MLVYSLNYQDTHTQPTGTSIIIANRENPIKSNKKCRANHPFSSIHHWRWLNHREANKRQLNKPTNQTANQRIQPANQRSQLSNKSTSQQANKLIILANKKTSSKSNSERIWRWQPPPVIRASDPSRRRWGTNCRSPDPQIQSDRTNAKKLTNGRSLEHSENPTLVDEGQ